LAEALLLNTPLELEIIDRIARDGPMAFRDFMEIALYDRRFGYYNTARPKIGADGDFYTSSNVHAVFGELLGDLFARLVDEDQRAGSGSNGPRAVSEHPVLVELGAGTGRLAHDVLTGLSSDHPGLFERISYRIVEASPTMLALQKDRLESFGERVGWVSLEDLESDPVSGVFFSNELIDAFPVHVVQRLGGRLQELFVVLADAMDGGTDQVPEAAAPTPFAFAWGEPSRPGLSEYLARVDMTLADGERAEIGMEAIDWLERVARAQGNGFLVTIDYGDTARHLIRPAPLIGTLRSFRRHWLTASVLERPGEQDITSSVNFTALMEYGRDHGYDVVSYERQAAFLTRMGLFDRLSRIVSSDEGLDDLRSRLALKNLLVPGGMGENFRVLIQRRVP
jgi:SAM-dependent MidA family methyltransferase